MSRRFLAVATLAASAALAVLVAAVPAQAAVHGAAHGVVAGPPPVSGPTPTCLIADGVGFSKTVACAQLLTLGPTHAGHGSYEPGGWRGVDTLTETVQFQPDNGPVDHWQTLATTIVRGPGPLQATTPPVRIPPRLGQFRACTAISVLTFGHPANHTVCSSVVR